MLVPVKKSDSFVFQVAYRLFELRVDQKKNARWPKKHFRQNIVEIGSRTYYTHEFLRIPEFKNNILKNDVNSFREFLHLS